MKRMFTVLAMVLAALSISFMACSVSSDNDDSSITANGVVNAETPLISKGLADGTYTVGAKATELSVEATVSDGGTLTYQWYKGEELIEGETSASYTPDTTTAGKITYKVVVTNTNNNVNGKTTATAESSATVTVIDSTKTNAEKPVSIKGITGTTEYKQGDTASALTIEATVTDGGNLSYQWYKNEVKITGATSASYTPDTTTAGTITYKVRVTNTNNTVDGNKTAIVDFDIQVTITAIVNAETPKIIIGLENKTYTVGATATALSVEATVSDGGTLTYQWYKGDEEISGATSNSYTPSTEAAGTFTYKVVVTNTNESVTGVKTATETKSAIITVIDPSKTNAEIPKSSSGITGTKEYKQGDTASALTIEATVKDGGMLTYQWYKNEVEITGETSASYTPDTKTAGTFIYKVRVTNTNNSVTGNRTAIEDFDIQVTITAIVNAATPLISKGLADGTYTVGATATALSVEATVSDGGTLTYQWYKGEELIEGATSASYTPDITTAGKITYKVVVTNTNNNVNGKTTATAASSATVTVKGNEDKIGSGNIGFDFN